MSTPAANTPSAVTPIIMAPMLTVPTIMARWSDFTSLYPIVRTTDCGRTNVNTPTSSHWVRYSDGGMLPPDVGSSISG